MPTHPDWIEHRRGDGELLGWMRPEGDGFVVVDLLGREGTDVLDWLAAEQFLEERGIGYLAEPYELLVGDRWIRVRLTEVSPGGIHLKKEDWGAMDIPELTFDLPFPASEDSLRVYVR